MEKKAVVLGWPIKHSRSPLIHNHWLDRYGISGSYEKSAVEPDKLEHFLTGCADKGIVGANLTVPHKEAVFKLADEVDDTAAAIGAANTIWWEDGKLYASNTDVYGFMTHLECSAPGWDKRDGPVAVLGAGGAARGILYGLLQHGVEEIRLFNRTRERAEALETLFSTMGFPGKIRVENWENCNTGLSGCHTLVNTTVLGMEGSHPLDIDLSAMKEESVIFDIVYAPLETALLARAKTRGYHCVDGLGMLLHQAVPGFEQWFGKRPEVTDELRDIIVKDLTGG